jgi:hypothetical protein
MWVPIINIISILRSLVSEAPDSLRKLGPNSEKEITYSSDEALIKEVMR